MPSIQVPRNISSAVRSVRMGPQSHVYEMEIEGKKMTFKDSGRFGVVEEGIDSADDSAVMTKYANIIQKNISLTRLTIIHSLTAVVPKILLKKRASGLSESSYIDFGFNRWCGRKSDRRPYSQTLSLGDIQGIGSEIHIFDHTGDDKVDEVFFVTPDGMDVHIRAYEPGPVTQIWDGSKQSCYNVDPFRKGVEIFLKLLDPIYGRDEKAICRRYV